MPSKQRNNVWASNRPDQTEELTTPSGQTCEAKKVGVEGLIEMGILNQMDSLTALVDQYTKDVKKHGPGGPVTTELDEAKLMADPESVKAIISLADRALPVIVVDPPVALHFTERTVGKTTVVKRLSEAERNTLREERGQPDLIFTDQVDFEDKMWLFDWATGGLQKMATFRRGSSDDVATVDNEPKSPRATKRTPRRK